MGEARAQFMKNTMFSPHVVPSKTEDESDNSHKVARFVEEQSYQNSLKKKIGNMESPLST